jgi:hypothetical protein
VGAAVPPGAQTTRHKIGLLPRLRRVERKRWRLQQLEDRVAFAREDLDGAGS